MTKDEKSLEDTSFDEAANVHLVFLKIIGLIVFKNHTMRYIPTILFSLYVHLSHVLVSSMYICDIVISSVVDPDPHYDVQVIAECVGVCGVHIRFFIMFMRRAKIAEMLAESRRLWADLTDDEKNVMKNFIEKSVKLTEFYGGICVVFLTVSQVSLFMPRSNETLPRSLSYPFYSAVQKSPWFELSAIVQMFGIIGISISGTGIDTIGPFLTMITCGHLRNLSIRLQKSDQLEINDQLKNFKSQIIDCIVYHQKIIKFYHKIEKMMNVLFMTQLFSSTYNMSLCGLKLVGNDPEKLKYLSVLIILLTQLFACQWAPDILVSESEYLTTRTYIVPISNKDEYKKVAKFIQILMLRSQRSLQLKAGGYFTLSMQSFSTLITNAVSFFTVLRSIN